MNGGKAVLPIPKTFAKSIDLGRVLLIAGTTILVLVYGIMALRVFSDPVQRTGSDFIAFYAAGRVAQVYSPSQIYDISLEQSIQQEVVKFELEPGQILLYNHVPFLLPFILAVTNWNYLDSFIRWAILLLAVFSAGIFLLRQIFLGKNWDKKDRRVVLFGLLLFFPSFISLLNGQDSAFTFFGLALWAVGLLTRRDWLSGLGLALVCVRPQIAFMLAAPFLFRRQRVLLWFAAFLSGLGLFSLAIVGPNGLIAFLKLLFVSAQGNWFGLHENAMVDLVGLLWRIVPGLGGSAIRSVGWAGYAAGLILLCFQWQRFHALEEQYICSAVVLALFFSPHLHYHDLALLIVPLAVTILHLTRKGNLSTRMASLLPLASSLFLLICSLIPLLKYNAPILWMVFLVFLAYRPDWIFFRRMK
jgi:hypothetical protein